MPNFQFYNPYRRPNLYNYRPYRTYYAPTNITNNPIPSDTQTINSNTEPQEKIKSNRTLYNSKDENVWLDIFGIKLYFDDVLILSLLFFLYKEEVKDEGLFLALVLLLIS